MRLRGVYQLVWAYISCILEQEELLETLQALLFQNANDTIECLEFRFDSRILGINLLLKEGHMSASAFKDYLKRRGRQHVAYDIITKKMYCVFDNIELHMYRASDRNVYPSSSYISTFRSRGGLHLTIFVLSPILISPIDRVRAVQFIVMDIMQNVSAVHTREGLFDSPRAVRQSY